MRINKNNSWSMFAKGLAFTMATKAVEELVEDLPMKIYNKYFTKDTCQLVIEETDESFFDFLQWMSSNYKKQNFSNLKVANGRWGEGATMVTFGYGDHLINFKGETLRVSFKNEGDKQKLETLVITKQGKDRVLFDELVDEITKSENTDDDIKLFKWDSGWRTVRCQPIRPMDSVFIGNEIKTNLLKRLDNFANNEQWYVDNGIPYQLGILLYGPAGTGKTSAVKAVAGYLKYPIYYLSANQLNHIEEASSRLPNKCVIVIEDIDSSTVTHDRETASVMKQGKGVNGEDLASILNSIDGLLSSHGRIFMATTNHIEKLDSALIRHGRIDMKIEIGYVTNETFGMFLDNFYPKHGVDVDAITLQEGLTMSELQNMVLEDWIVEDIIKEITQ